MPGSLQVEAYLPEVTLLSRNLPGSYWFPVLAAMVRGSRHRVVIDTLIRPADMAPFADATLVVYTHSDWDHCWGTAALPGRPVIGHQLTRERLADPRVTAYLEERQRQDPEGFAGSQIILPDLTFTDRLSIDAGGLTLELHHLPGHTADSVVVYLPEQSLLLAGDAVEGPLPSLNEVGQIRAWAQGLRQWGQAGLKHVIPSHGRPGGPELLQRNAEYIERLIEGAERDLAAGRDLAEIEANLPIETFLPADQLDQLPPYYRTCHRQNIAQVVTELQAVEASA